MKLLNIIIILAMIMVSCKEPIITGPKVNPNTCPKCGETKTYEILDLGNMYKGQVNRRCSHCKYAWNCIGCTTKPLFNF